MASIYSISQLNLGNSISNSEKSTLSEKTKRKLKALGIDVNSILSEDEAKKAIEKAEKNTEVETDKSTTSITEEEKLYNDIKNLARKLGININKSTNIEDILNKIAAKLDEIKENSGNSNLNIFKSELESLELRFKNLYTGESSILSAMDLMAQNNRSVLGI